MHEGNCPYRLVRCNLLITRPHCDDIIPSAGFLNHVVNKHAMKNCFVSTYDLGTLTYLTVNVPERIFHVTGHSNLGFITLSKYGHHYFPNVGALPMGFGTYGFISWVLSLRLTNSIIQSK